LTISRMLASSLSIRPAGIEKSMEWKHASVIG
jgi:hypothetical protein